MGICVMALAVVVSILTLAFAPLEIDRSAASRCSAASSCSAISSQQSVYGDNFASPGSVRRHGRRSASSGCPPCVLLEALASLVGRRVAPLHQLLHGVQQRRRTPWPALRGARSCTRPPGTASAGSRCSASERSQGSPTTWSTSPSLVAATAVVEKRRPLDVFRETAAWLAPHHVVYGILAAGIVLADQSLGLLGILVFAMPAAAMLIATGQYLRATERLVEELRTKNQTLEALLGENRGLLASLSRGHLQLIRGLAQAIDAKDPYTAGHTSRVAQYSVRIASALGLDDATRREIEHGALLHDIGKIGVPDAVLSKPGPLDADEWEAMRRHPLVAIAILEGVELSPIVISMVRHHHENLDGTGYPDHLSGDELPLAARIARVADAFDAMTSDRPYRDALSLTAARGELRRNAGTQFCPEIVDAFEGLIDRGQLERVLGRRDDAARRRTA